MRWLHQTQIAVCALIGMLACCAPGCTPEELASVNEALASSAGTALSMFFNFAVDFGRQVLAAFLF